MIMSGWRGRSVAQDVEVEVSGKEGSEVKWRTGEEKKKAKFHRLQLLILYETK